MDYAEWNDRLVAHFFQSDYEGRRIFLYVTPDVLVDIAGHPDAVQDYVTAVTNGPPGTTRQGLCQRALQTFERWRDREGFPPYVAYLGLFVLAAGIEGDFAPTAYYPRLRQVLGEEPTSGQYPSFHRMLELWDDLERWANEQQAGRLGIFKSDIAGNWIHVGLPIAQTLLTEYERELLPAVFSDAGLESGSTPTDEQLAQIILTWGQRRLRPRTLQLLERNGNNDPAIRTLILQAVLDELHEWNGYCFQDDQDGKCISGALRLCAQLDRVAGRLTVTVRCKKSEDLPEGGLSLKSDLLSRKLFCEEHALGWSTELIDYDEATNVNGSELDWAHGAVMHSTDGIWRFSLRGSDVRIFEIGSRHGIPGIVECSRLPSQGEFYLICHARVAREIESWGLMNCARFETVPIDDGLPTGWLMFVGTGPKKDERIRDKFPMLSFNEGVRLSCEGGIQHGRNRYFTFAPPRVLLDGGDDATTVWADGTVLVPHSERLAVFELPPEIVISGKLLIEAKHGSEVLARRSIYFSDESVAKQIEPPWCDRFGRYVEKAESNDAIVSGSIVKGTQPTFEGFFLPDLHFIRGGILIGSEAGQIASLPQEPFPSNWEPVWLVTIERRGTVLFCGKGISDAEPKSYRFADRRRLKHWKEVLWHWRRRITPPTHPSLAALWQRYQREARNL